MSLSANLYRFSAMSIPYSAQEAQDQCYEDVWIIRMRTSSYPGVSRLYQSPRHLKAHCNRPAGLALLPSLALGFFAHSACVQSILTAMTIPKAVSCPNTLWLLILILKKLQYIDFAMSCRPEETGIHELSKRNDTHLK